MTRTGLTLGSPPIGQTITFVRTADDSDGAELVIKARMRPGASIPPHRHLHQDESFEVLGGLATFGVDGERIEAGVGDHVRIPAGTAHRFRNRSDADVLLRSTLSPALRAEELFEQLFRLGGEGKVNRFGAPSPLESARLIREFREEFFYLAALPVALQRMIAGAKP